MEKKNKASFIRKAPSASATNASHLGNDRKINLVTPEKSRNFSYVIKKVIITLLVLLLIGVLSVLFLLYGPYRGFREWLITTAMKTMSHQYLATWFYSEETIADVLSRNKIEDVGGATDPSQIDQEIKDTYENAFEEAILKRDEDNNDYKIIKILEKKFEGYLVAIYDPSRIQVVMTKEYPLEGQYVTEMTQENDGIIGINGGNFFDPQHAATGGRPIGITIVNKKVTTMQQFKEYVVGFDKNNKLIIGERDKISLKEAVELELRDVVTCLGPRLITNGRKSLIFGNGGWGNGPRTAIGQRRDGIVLLLVLDGRTLLKQGANMNDLISIMSDYGAHNAVNLDGGTSSVLTVRNNNDEVKLVNDPIDSKGRHQTRPVPTGFILKKDEQNKGDHSAVDDKL